MKLFPNNALSDSKIVTKKSLLPSNETRLLTPWEIFVGISYTS